MATKIVCDTCGKEIGRQLQLMNNGEHWVFPRRWGDFCSFACLLTEVREL